MTYDIVKWRMTSHKWRMTSSNDVWHRQMTYDIVKWRMTSHKWRMTSHKWRMTSSNDVWHHTNDVWHRQMTYDIVKWRMTSHKWRLCDVDSASYLVCVSHATQKLSVLCNTLFLWHTDTSCDVCFCKSLYMCAKETYTYAKVTCIYVKWDLYVRQKWCMQTSQDASNRHWVEWLIYIRDVTYHMWHIRTDHSNGSHTLYLWVCVSLSFFLSLFPSLSLPLSPSL